MYNIEVLRAERKQLLTETQNLCDLVLEFNSKLTDYTNVRATYALNNYRLDWEYNNKEYQIQSETIEGLTNKIIKVIEQYG